MGQTCCKNQNVDFGVSDFVPKHDQFEVVQMIKSDPLIQEWLATNNNSAILQENQNHSQPKKFWKVKDKNIYYYFNQADKIPDGYGFIYEPNKTFYSGSVKKGIPEGKAVVKFLDKQCVYEGYVKGWRAHGSGIFQNKKQNYKVNGNWVNSIPTSVMISFYNDPNMQSLEISDFTQRKGNISYKDKRWYEGEIHTKKFTPHGYGKLIFPFDDHKKQYDGQWYLGQMSGKGRIIYSNQSVYDGQFFHGKKQGFGKFIYPNKSFYEGYWKDGKQEGVGASYSSDGKIMKYGMWKNGKLDYQLDEKEWKQKSSIYKHQASKMVLQQQSDQINRNQSSQYKMKMTESRTYADLA